MKSLVMDYIKKIMMLEVSERKTFLLSCLYFFLLLTAYYLLRPLRDGMGIIAGVQNLPMMFTATFGVMILAVPLYGYLVKKMNRIRFLITTYLFFAGNILVFYSLFRLEIAIASTAFIFFVWLSVFSLFAVSIFWSFMSDLFSPEQSRRLYGGIAAGGSLGAITGPLLTALLAKELGPYHLLLIASFLLLGCMWVIIRLAGFSSREKQDKWLVPIRGSVIGGIREVLQSRMLMGIVSFVFLYSFLHTILYLLQVEMISDSIMSSGERTALFGRIDLWVNLLAIGIQFFLTGRLFSYLGIAFSLALIPLLVSVGFVNLSLYPNLSLVILSLVILRAGNFSILRPGKESLFTVLADSKRYKAKSFIDTAVFRGGDALTSWIFSALQGIGMSMAGLSLMAIPFALIWSFNGFKLGKGYEKRLLSLKKQLNYIR